MKQEGSIYELNGYVPLKKAVPIGVQHVLTMFVNNITPILVIGALCNLTAGEKSMVLQNAMFIATLTAASVYGYNAVPERMATVPGRICSLDLPLCLLS